KPQFSNRILAALPQKANRRFFSALTQVELPLGQVLYKPGTVTSHVYFPNDCMISLLAVAERDSGLEVGLVGAEGMVGVPLALGVSKSPVRALVQGAGSAMRMSAARFATELERNRQLLEPRLARWLLMTRDRVAADRFRFTQQFIALMLGVRRAGVNGAAAALQRRGLIRYSRGMMQILDREGLLARSCSCYGVIRRLENA